LKRIDRRTLVFLDASCLIAAAGRPDGGSGFILSLCARRLLRASVSQPVLLEAEKNIAEKLGDSALATFHLLLAETPMVVAPVPLPADRETSRTIVGEKDDHVLASALAVEAPFLLTLDQPLAQAVNDARLTLRAFVPGLFIVGILPAHAEFSALRE
jgi:predicted nucleic acid-binding protein